MKLIFYKELWRSIEETGNRYKISSFGNVCNNDNRLLKPYGKAYKRVKLYCPIIDKWKEFYVHILVAKYFIGLRPKNKEVSHKDLNKGNNKWDNLEYTTHRKNVKHAIKNGVIWGSRSGNLHSNAVLSFKLAAKIRKLYKTRKYGLEELGRKFGVSNFPVWEIVHGKRWRTMRLKVYVLINNRTALLLRPYPYEKLIPYWSHSIENYQYIMNSRPWYRNCKICRKPKGAHKKIKDHEYIPSWDGKAKFLKRDRLPVGLFWATYKEIQEKENIKFKVRIDKRVPSLTKEKYWVRSEGKYSFQNDCVDSIQNAILKGRGGLVLNATGSGKTRIAAMVGARFDCEFLFVVDQLNLLYQAQKDISNHLGEKVGFIGESKFKIKRFTVATRQTLALHLNDSKFRKWFEKVDVVYVDEIHEQMNKSNFDVMKVAKPLSVIGLTATLGISKKPTRLKAFSLTGPVLYEYPITKGMKEGVLAKGIGIQLLYNNAIEELDAYSAKEAYDEKIVRNSERNWLIAEIVSRANKLGWYTLVLVERLKHLEKISNRLKNVPHKIVSGTFKGEKITISTRMKSKERFEKGKVRVILANKVFKKGVDIKRLDLIINAAGRKSKDDAIQIFGRGLRTHVDKIGLICIDITDVDHFDSDRKKKNWLARAAKSRIRALSKSGITVKKFKYNDEEDIKVLFHKADKWLNDEVNR